MINYEFSLEPKEIENNDKTISHEVPSSIIEHDNNPPALGEMSEQLLGELEGEAWVITEASYEFEGERHAVHLQDGSMFLFDPTRVETAEIPVHLLQEKYGYDLSNEDLVDNFQPKTKAYRYIGVTEDGSILIFAKPRLKEFKINLPDNAKWAKQDPSVSTMKRNVLEINNLQIELSSLPYNKDLIDYFDGAIMMSFQRDNLESKGLDPEGYPIALSTRNPEVAKPTLRRELKEFIKIVKELGYNKIIATPSDDRRRRIYIKMGMVPIPNTDYLIINL